MNFILGLLLSIMTRFFPMATFPKEDALKNITCFVSFKRGVKTSSL
jgi:hypothetical protein